MAPHRVLITGVSGYIGGTILSTLLQTDEPWVRNLEISALVRKTSQAETVAALGVQAVLFDSLDQSDRLELIGQDFDVIVHAAAGWHELSARSLIIGMGKRREKAGKAVHYLHISGTSNVSDRPHTQGYVESRTFSDAEDIYSYEKYRQSFEVYPQRTTDITVVETGEALGVSTYIVMAPTLFGLGTGPFNRYSIPIGAMLGPTLKQGHVAVLGEGKTVWSHIHIKDVAALFMVLLKNIELENDVPKGRKGIYFSATGEHTHLEFSERMAQACYELKLLPSASVKQVDLEEAANNWVNGIQNMAELAYGANARTRSVLGPKLGWKPQHEDKWEGTFVAEVEAIHSHPPAERSLGDIFEALGEK
ncbi:NAD dependent epimerase dehydratase family protein [Seiridium cupressi]